MSAFLVLVPSAFGASTLAVEIDRSPAQINRGDESVRYVVEVANTSLSDSTSGPLDLAISLPPGLTLAFASGPGWSCSPALLSCESSAVVPAGGSYPLLDLSPVWIDDTAADQIEVSVTASGGGAATAVSAEDSFTFGPAVSFGLSFADVSIGDEAGAEVTQAGAHPHEVSGAFETPLRRGPVPGSLLPVESLRGGAVELPAGMVASLRAVTAVCDFAALKEDECPDAAAVGGVKALMEPTEASVAGPPSSEVPKDRVVYRLRDEGGYLANFGFRTEGPAYAMRFKLRSDGDYGLSEVFPLIPQAPIVYGIAFSLCGYGVALKANEIEFDRCKRRTDPSASPRALLSLGTSCANGPPLTRFAVDSWTRRGAFATSGLPELADPSWKVAEVSSPALTGCEQLTEEWTGVDEPSFDLRPDNQAADSPVAYTARLHVPQDGLEDPDGLATAHLEDAEVSLPPGLSLNPAVADGLRACSEEQIGLIGTGFPAPGRIRFDARPANCPDASKIGTASIVTPLFEDPLPGAVFLATPEQNPFGSDYAVYVAIEAPGPGIVAKLPGRVELDPVTGQVAVSLPDLPQLPFEDLELRLFGGSRAALANPVTCGEREVSTALTPWSAADPDRPRADEIARPADQISIASGPGGMPCAPGPADRPLDVDFSGGSRTPVAGASSPFSLRVTRPDGSQELDRIEVSPPAGFVAALRGIPACPEARIAAAAAISAAAEREAPSCPPDSRVGSVDVGAGAGASPFYVSGEVYLAGPHRGAPLSVVAIAPALAGPFDLGNVVVRSALEIDRRTARVTVATDPIPRILRGVPLRIRDIWIRLDRPAWARNPTSCDPAAVDATVRGADGAASTRSNRFQVGNCRSLAFRPKLSIGLTGGTARNGHPALTVRLTQAAGQANLGRASVVLPRSELLAQSHIRSVCTRAQFAREACPSSSIYGRAEAGTLLLDQPLRGPVYLRSSDHELPDLVAALSGPPRQPIEIDLVGRVDSVNGRIRASFGSIPDAPVSRFVLRMRGGRRSLLANSQDLCAGTHRAGVHVVAQNGKRRDLSPVVRARCGKEHTPTALGNLHR